jgi:hypothetical protein
MKETTPSLSLRTLNGLDSADERRQVFIADAKGAFVEADDGEAPLADVPA